MNHRLTAAAGLAVILASISLFAVVGGTGWLYAGIGAVAVMAAAGTLTRLAPIPAAAGATGLGLLASLPLITSGVWYAQAGAVVILAVAALSATRQRLLRAAATVITYAAALLAYLSLISASAYSAAGILPTAASARHLGVLVGQAMSESRLAPPVTPVPGIVLVTAGGIGIIAACTDLIAVRLRSPAIAGLPLLILFSVPVTTSAKSSGIPEVITFCLGVTGFLRLLAADSRDRLRIWGRLVTVWRDAGAPEPSQGPNTTALSASGRRVGLAAICVAVIVPLLVPGLHVRRLFPHDGGPGTGSLLPNPLLRMDDELRLSRALPVLSYRMISGDRSAGQYLQVYVFNYDSSGQSWEPAGPHGPSQVISPAMPLHTPALSPGVTTETVRLHIRLRSLNGYGSSLLPLPYPAASLQAAGAWQEDDDTGQVFSSSQSLSGLTYSVTSKEPQPTTSEESAALSVPPAGQKSYLSFATPYRARLLQVADGIINKAHAVTPFAKAVALQNWFLTKGHFRYDLRPGLPNGAAGLLDFLTRKRAGFCQQFAQAMADLARLAGIPSRVAVGFTGGTRQRDGSWLVTTSDYHAWPELYFDGLGWLRFEPTPGGSIGQGTAVQPSYASPKTAAQQAGPGPSTAPAGSLPRSSASSNPGGSSKLKHPDGSGGGPVSAAAGRQHGSVLPVVLTVLILLALACAAPAASRWVIGRRRWHAARGDARQAHAAWRELRACLADYGLGARASESPRAVATRISAAGSLDEPAAAALRRIASAEEQASYATVPQRAGDLRADVTTVRRALARQATRRAAWRARLLPASVLAPAQVALRSAPDVFGWLDMARIRGRGRPSGHRATGAGTS